METPAPGITASLTGTGTDGATGAFRPRRPIVGTDNFPNSVSTLEWEHDRRFYRARYYERDTVLFVVFYLQKFGSSGPVTGAWHWKAAR